MTRFFMRDLETMGTTPGCAIVSDGLIAFNPWARTVDELFPDFGHYTVVTRESCLDAFLHEEDGTKAWWAAQAAKSPAAGKAVEEYRANKGLTVGNAMAAAEEYIAGHCGPKSALVYGNGADFDNPIVAVAARMVGYTIPWKYGNRCYRTLKNLNELFGPPMAAPKLARVGTYHNALDDAKSQAMHLWEIVHGIRSNMKEFDDGK